MNISYLEYETMKRGIKYNLVQLLLKVELTFDKAQ